MAEIITVANQKGGVSKTATCRYIADICVDQGKKVLLIDFDPQASLTKGFGLDPKLFEGVNTSNICNMFYKEIVQVIDIADEESDDVFHLIPSNRELGLIGREIFGLDLILRNFIKTHQLREVYDVIIIDNNPKFDAMLINTILASNIIVVPVITTKDEQEGLHGFFQNMEELLSAYSYEVEKVVIVPSRYNKKTNVHKTYLKIIEEEMPLYIQNSCPIIATSKVSVSKPVPEKVVFQDASSYQLSVYKFLKEHSSQLKKEDREKLLHLLEKIVKNILKK